MKLENIKNQKMLIFIEKSEDYVYLNTFFNFNNKKIKEKLKGLFCQTVNGKKSGYIISDFDTILGLGNLTNEISVEEFSKFNPINTN